MLYKRDPIKIRVCLFHTSSTSWFHPNQTSLDLLLAMSAQKQKAASAISPASIKETKSTGSVGSKASSPAPTTEHASTSSSAKPDRAAFEAEKARIRSEIDVLQENLVRYFLNSNVART